MKKVFLSISLFWTLSIGLAFAQPVKVTLLKSFKNAHCQHPKWSAKGRYLAFEVNYMKKRIIELQIYDCKTHRTTIVRPSTLKVRGFRLGGSSSKRGMVSKDLSWAPKGKKFLFSSNGSGSVYNVFQSDEGRLKINSRSKNDGQPNWSPDGKRVVFTSGRSGMGDLYWYNVRRMRARRLTRDNQSTELFPVWSPKSSKMLAFVRHTDQEDRIYLVTNIFARRIKRLTKWRSKLSELNPSWSPNGKLIAFFTINPEGVYGIYVSNLKGKVKFLAKNVAKSDQYGPTWSPDGKYIFFVQKLAQNKDEIRAINVKTGKIHRIITGTQVNNEIAVTKKNGKWVLAFTAQGRLGSSQQNYRKLFIAKINPL